MVTWNLNFSYIILQIVNKTSKEHMWLRWWTTDQTPAPPSYQCQALNTQLLRCINKIHARQWNITEFIRVEIQKQGSHCLSSISSFSMQSSGSSESVAGRKKAWMPKWMEWSLLTAVERRGEKKRKCLKEEEAAKKKKKNIQTKPYKQLLISPKALIE